MSGEKREVGTLALAETQEESRGWRGVVSGSQQEARTGLSHRDAGEAAKGAQEEGDARAGSQRTNMGTGTCPSAGPPREDEPKAWLAVGEGRVETGQGGGRAPASPALGLQGC